MSNDNDFDPTVTGNRGNRRVYILAGIFAAIFVIGLFGVWLLFHSIPTAQSLGDMLRKADSIEIFRLVDGKAVRWIRLQEPNRWEDLPSKIAFKETFWKFSREPADAIVIQVFSHGERFGAWEVRGDDHLHIRKAARWYRMPAAPEFEAKVRQLLNEFGQDLPTSAPQK